MSAGMEIMHVDRRRTRDDDEIRNHVGPYSARHDVETRIAVIPFAYALFDDRSLDVELHPRRDRRANDSNDHDDVGFRRLDMRDDALVQNFVPIGMDDESADDICDIDEAEKEEDSFEQLCTSARYRHEDEGCRGNHERDLESLEAGHVQIAAEDRRRRRNSCELRGGIADVAQNEEQKAPEGYLHAEVLTDQIGQAFAGDRAHARAHLLNHNERDRNGHQQPEYRVAKLGAGLRVR